MQALDGCNRLPFAPSIDLAPHGQDASKPTGLTLDVHVPQEESLNAQGLAEGDVRDLTVTLPQGVVLNPAAGDGLQACSLEQIGFTGYKELDPFAEPNIKTATFNTSEPSCPQASKVAKATITTPLLLNPLTGAVYLASPQNFPGSQENPFGSLVALYIVVHDPVSGVLVKLAAEVAPNLSTGQVTATFKDTPQAPFEDAELHFFGGERPPLATPAHCAPYTTTASLTPWSASPPVNSTSTFQVTSGPNGAPCPGPSLPFKPTLTGGTLNINAGSFSPLTTTIGREDGNQNIAGVTLHMPPGLSGILSGISLCPEAQANEGTCPQESLIGETTVSVGVGGDPFTVTGGRVYITDSYKGAPFGLSIVNPAKAGPFDLENTAKQQPACDCVVVRATIEVNPTTAALTVTTDGSGPYAIPTFIEGIPLQIKHVNVLIDRPNFTFNPTSCNPQTITGSIASSEGATSPVSVPFQVTNCAILKFAPKFSVSTGAHTSKAMSSLPRPDRSSLSDW
jgi:hypothetical protein